MKIKKLIRQFGEHENEYSPVEVGDKVNEIIDFLFSGPMNLVEKPKKEEEPKKDFTPVEIKTEGVAVRSQATQDMVYLVKDGKKHWIKNPETLRKLGFDFHKVKNITNQEMTSYETGKPIDLKEKPIAVQKTQNEFDKYNL